MTKGLWGLYPEYFTIGKKIYDNKSFMFVQEKMADLGTDRESVHTVYSVC